jgi:hypothetical protein
MLMMAGVLIVCLEQVDAEIVFKIAPYTVDVIGIVLCIVIL